MENPNDVFLDPVVQTITITRFTEEEVLSPNFSHDEVMSHFIHNRILREWVYHAYPYGYQFLHQHLRNGDWHYDDNCYGTAI